MYNITFGKRKFLKTFHNDCYVMQNTLTSSIYVD